jgi:hypothetical protein
VVVCRQTSGHIIDPLIVVLRRTGSEVRESRRDAWEHRNCQNKSLACRSVRRVTGKVCKSVGGRGTLQELRLKQAMRSKAGPIRAWRMV